MLKLKPNSTATAATKKKGKSRSGNKQPQGKGNLMVEEKRENQNDENRVVSVSESLMVKTEEVPVQQPEMGCWVDENWPCYCFLCAVVEQTSWGTSGWCPELMGGGVEANHHHQNKLQNHNGLGSDVLWDDCIWDLKEFEDEFNPLLQR